MPIPFGDSYEKDKEELFRQVEEYFSIMSFLAQPAHSSSEEEAKRNREYEEKLNKEKERLLNSIQHALNII